MAFAKLTRMMGCEVDSAPFVPSANWVGEWIARGLPDGKQRWQGITIWIKGVGETRL
jgi:hypothetical protein